MLAKTWWPLYCKNKIQGYSRIFKDIFGFFQGSRVFKFQDVQGLSSNLVSFSRIFKDIEVKKNGSTRNTQLYDTTQPHPTQTERHTHRQPSLYTPCLLPLVGGKLACLRDKNFLEIMYQ